MREIILRVPAFAVEDVLDRLLTLVPGGVREVPRGRDVELRMRGPELPGRAELERAAGRWPRYITEHEVSDDWRERRRADYEHDVIAGRLVVRPDWAPPAPRGMLEIVLSESAAFGAGSHPTTRTCLELLLAVQSAGSFADLGCGTGVLALLAAKLGWAPVQAVDRDPDSVAAALANARGNRVNVAARVGDLSAESPPLAAGIAANVPAPLHARIAAGLADPVPRLALLSGFGPEAAASVIDAYRQRGLKEEQRVETRGWVVALLEVETDSRPSAVALGMMVQETSAGG
jgi:ribosomal protein L11 methyltransferase